MERGKSGEILFMPYEFQPLFLIVSGYLHYFAGSLEEKEFTNLLGIMRQSGEAASRIYLTQLGARRPSDSPPKQLCISQDFKPLAAAIRWAAENYQIQDADTQLVVPTLLDQQDVAVSDDSAVPIEPLHDLFGTLASKETLRTAGQFALHWLAQLQPTTS